MSPSTKRFQGKLTNLLSLNVTTVVIDEDGGQLVSRYVSSCKSPGQSKS